MAWRFCSRWSLTISPLSSKAIHFSPMACCIVWVNAELRFPVIQAVIFIGVSPPQGLDDCWRGTRGFPFSTTEAVNSSLVALSALCHHQQPNYTCRHSNWILSSFSQAYIVTGPLMKRCFSPVRIEYRMSWSGYFKFDHPYWKPK